MNPKPRQRFPGVDRIVPVGTTFTAATQEAANHLIFGESDIGRTVAIGHKGERPSDSAVGQAGFNDAGLVNPVWHLAGIEVIDRGPTGSWVQSEDDSVDTTPTIESQHNAWGIGGSSVERRVNAKRPMPAMDPSETRFSVVEAWIPDQGAVTKHPIEFKGEARGDSRGWRAEGVGR
jgi:hypothetical protein